jgi:HEPN domain-containing protein
MKDIDKTIKYWKDGAKYDLDTGRDLLRVERFPYALFFGHLSLEKLLKALYVKTKQKHAPFTHSLTYLAEQCNIKEKEIMDSLSEFNEFYIEARYPTAKKEFYDKCTEKFAQEKFSRIEEVFVWLTKKL